MKMRFLMVGASVALVSLAYTLAHGETAKKPSRSVGARTRLASWIAAPAISMDLIGFTLSRP